MRSALVSDRKRLMRPSASAPFTSSARVPTTRISSRSTVTSTALNHASGSRPWNHSDASDASGRSATCHPPRRPRRLSSVFMHYMITPQHKPGASIIPLVLTTPCPCGTGESYDGCCGPLLANVAQAATPEQLMRSRYTAFVTGDADHLFRTWHPRTRPDDVRPDPGTRWTGLRILAAEADTVEFVASWEGGAMHEVSRFEQRPGLRHRAAHGVAVGPHQATGPEQRAAEPARDHGGDVAQPGAAQHVEHRRPGSARRLAVVGRALDRTVRAQHEGRAVVPGVPVLTPQRGDEGAGVVLGRDPAQRAEEARPAVLDLGGRVAGDGDVRRHAGRCGDGSSTDSGGVADSSTASGGTEGSSASRSNGPGSQRTTTFSKPLCRCIRA